VFEFKIGKIHDLLSKEDLEIGVLYRNTFSDSVLYLASEFSDYPIFFFKDGRISISKHDDGFYVAEKGTKILFENE
jgi:hypothetical protein